MCGNGLDVTGLGEGLTGQQRAEQLIDQYGEEDDVADQLALSSQLPGSDAHTQRHTCLRQQRDAQILAHGGRAVGPGKSWENL